MSIIPWVVFLALVFGLLALDLGVLNRKIHEIHTGEALKWTGFWIGLALLFSVAIYFMYEMHWCGIGLHEGANESGKEAVVNYLTGYLIEKALSLDNIAVMAMIFASFGIPLKFQHRVLFWGILGALIFRGIMIGAGAALVSSFNWVLYIFGVLLLFIAVKSTFGHEEEVDPQDKWITKFLKKHFRYTGKVEGMHFVQKIDGKTFMTPLLVALIVIELSDVIFAVDSIPAIFGITTDPFIVFTSNIFAILGLRSLYFVLASFIERFAMMKYAIGAILFFVGVKLLLPAGYSIYNAITGADAVAPHLPNWTSLAVVVVAVVAGVVASILYNKKHPVEAADEKAAATAASDSEQAAEAAADTEQSAEAAADSEQSVEAASDAEQAAETSDDAKDSEEPSSAEKDSGDAKTGE